MSARDAACAELPPAVVDKYFRASHDEAPFEYLTAKAICRQCPAERWCLANAIGLTRDQRGSAIFGGESDSALRGLRGHYLAGADLDELVDQALAQQHGATTVNQSPSLREGRFHDVQPARPDLAAAS